MTKSRDPNMPDDMLPDDGRPAAGSGAQSAAEHDTIAAAGASGSVADDDLLAVVTSMSTDSVSGIDQTLEQLTTSTDLFDVPPLDLDGTA